ncbi:glycoside hydrolase family 13 protein [Pseudonocardia broussonetiae]|uniref:Glycoside hydrolase family 13 protein n=1 Tax=Pseudonocardia broussonetiae TaxID=2736640 RepID=A0A6M6JSB7_9PSEU|nr:glycoside hydrolase family 13 protein [Pseudonocardia broussonetiae]QJY50260.1 glycoside hydrolase family 13 protein [Pseudonocardia broussonetiae]
MQWWREAVVYRVYVRSFTDSDGDGIGDLEGIRARLGYLELLGVDALSLAPFYPSPMADHGYDVADPRDVDPVYGDLAVFDALVTDAHEHGLKIIVDLVPNHTSVEHEWFRAARTSKPGSPERERFHFRPGRGPGGQEPPNDWQSVFGGPAWTRLPDDPEWYLHLFSPAQPDLDWTNPEVWADLDKTVRFWLDRGVDGFRVDVAHGMSKPEGLPDAGGCRDDPRFDHEGVHDVHRMVRAVVDHFPGTVLVGQVDVRDDDAFARYVRPDELHVGLTYRLLECPFAADAVRDAIEDSFEAVAPTRSRPSWALADHDTVRPVTRWGGEARARAMALVTLALPGTVFLYNGEELGLPDVELPDEALQDPRWTQSGGTDRGRDGCRVPIPWEGTAPGFGFTSGEPWLPIPAQWADRLVADQLEDTASTLSVYRRALELRRCHPGFTGTDVEWFGAPQDCLAFRRSGSTLVCALNTGTVAVPLPPGDVLLSSGPLRGGLLPPDTAVWLA